MEIFQTLLRADSSVNVRGDFDGETPLISAARWDFFAGIHQLIARGGSLRFEDVAEDEFPLIPGTLETMKGLCGRTFEFEQMCLRVLDRLEDICSQLQQRDKANDQQDTLVAFTVVIFRFCRLLLEIEKKQGPLSRFTGSRATASKIEAFHEELDIFTTSLGLVDSGNNWKEQWVEAQSQSMGHFDEALRTDEALAHEFIFVAQRTSAILLLQYELEARGGDTIPGLQERVESVRDRLLHKYAMEVPVVPDWLVSRKDVEYHSWNLVRAENEGDYYESKWRKTSVMVEENSHFDAFERDAAEWYQLNHANVVKLFGASNIEGNHFFMYELVPDAKPLNEFLSDDSKRALTWKCLYETGLGLQHLHNRGIVHKNLRGDSIIVGSDSVAKLCGLRHLDRYGDDGSRSIWKAPEIVNIFYDPPLTTACDIYAFGKCIWAALTLELPGKGFSVDRPANIGDEEWDLIMEMCADKPSERVNIACVVIRLKQFLIEGEHDHKSTSGGSIKVRPP